MSILIEIHIKIKGVAVLFMHKNIFKGKVLIKGDEICIMNNSINKEKVNNLFTAIKNEIFENGTDEEYNEYIGKVQNLQIEFNNGSIIKPIKGAKNIRGNRSKIHIRIPDMKCNKCNGLFNSMDVAIKETTEYEGLEIAIFNCPICGKETDNLQCDYLK